MGSLQTLCLAAFLCLFGLVACEEAGAPGVALSDGWARATPPGAVTGAVYLTLRNTGPGEDQLVGLAVPGAAKAILHDQRMDGNIMRMRKAAAISLPSGEEVRLAPGGRHIMLMGLSAPLREGATLTLQLRFAHAPPAEIVVPVLAMGATGTSATGTNATGAHAH